MSETSDSEYSSSSYLLGAGSGSRSEYSSGTGSSFSAIEAEKEYPLPAFGYPEVNHGWVECNSKSFPGRIYYFNVDSGCSTWIRPVSRFVPTPLVRSLYLQSDEDFMDVAPLIVSDPDDEEDDCNNNCKIKSADGEALILSKKEERERTNFYDVMFKLYPRSVRPRRKKKKQEFEELLHINQEQSPCELDDLDENSNEDLEIFFPEICLICMDDPDNELMKSLKTVCANDSSSSESSGSLSDFSSWKRKDSDKSLSSPLMVSGISVASTVLMNNLQSLKQENSPSERFGYNNMSFEASMGREKFNGVSNGNCELSNALNSLNVDNSNNFTVAKREYNSPNSTLNYESSRESDTTSDEDEDDENRVKIDIFTCPKLKRIEISDLITSPRNRSGKRRKRKAPKKTVEEKLPLKKFIKTVCILNGITTVNYDYLTPQLPDGVIMSNLSDSGSSTCHDAWNALNVKEDPKKESPNNSTKESTKRYSFFTHDLLDITELCLSDSSSNSSCATVKRNKTVIKNGSKSQNIAKNSDSDSSDSSSSSCSSETSKSSRSSKDEKPIPEIPKKPNNNVQNHSPSSSNTSLNSDKSWVPSGSSDDDNY